MIITLTNSDMSGLQRLRSLMRQHTLSAYLVPHADAHQSEYSPTSTHRLAFISGFTGSAGTVVVTQDRALLFTDGRYFIQAKQQMVEGFELMKLGVDVTLDSFLKGIEGRVGVDSSLVTKADVSGIKDLVSDLPNLIDLVWEHNIVEDSKSIMVLDVKYSGEMMSSKISRVRKMMEDKKVGGILVTALDEVAWLLNLRGQDVDFNPVFTSYVIVEQTSITLFIDSSKLTSEVSKYLTDGGVRVKNYSEVFESLKALGLAKVKFWLDKKTSLKAIETYGSPDFILENGAIMELKAIKNEIELEGMRRCHLRDAVAICKYFHWLEDCLKNKQEISESHGSDVLLAFREKDGLFKGPSFDTISSIGPNGAIIHYKPTKGKDSLIDQKQVYLCDSGGQYLDGTTDTTRTVHFGSPSDHERKMFTLVLKGHIQLKSVLFPIGTTGLMVDVLARAALWKEGLDYKHGTGHGVGCFLNVHEGPHSISTKPFANDVSLKEGMVVTDEPGYYEEGSFGVRIENVVLVQKSKFEGFYGFENCTFVPIQMKMIMKELLTKEELTYLLNYNAECLAKVGPLMDGEPLEWLKRECSA